MARPRIARIALVALASAFALQAPSALAGAVSVYTYHVADAPDAPNPVHIVTNWNDMFERALPLFDGVPINQDNAEATWEQIGGEDLPCGMWTNTMWYSYQSVRPGYVSIDLRQTVYDHTAGVIATMASIDPYSTTFAVYAKGTGGISGLVFMGCADGRDGRSPSFGSFWFEPVPGETYFIQTAGVHGNAENGGYADIAVTRY
jgi:hypothetical protein